MGLKNLPENKRPREKAFLYGIKELSDEELIAVIFSCGYHNVDVLTLAHNLLIKYETLSNLSKIEINELTQNIGIKKTKAIKLQAAFELCRRIEQERIYEKIRVNSFDEILKIVKPYIHNLNNEKAFVILLSKNNLFISIKEISEGIEDAVMISNKAVVSIALKNNASKIILIHNHPSETLVASKEDVIITNNLMIACNIMGIRLIDHFIFTRSKAVSIFTKKQYNF